MQSAYQKLLNERKTDYKTWVPVYCPAIRDYVFFGMAGFNHLRFKIDNTPRKPKEAMYKMGLLPLVRPVIHNASKVDSYERRLSPVGGSRKKIYKEMEFWSFIEPVGKNRDVKVRVVLRRLIGSEHINFWSVMKYE